MVLMQQSCSYHDRCVLCHDIKFVATRLSYFYASENYHDILFFVATNLLFSPLRLLSRHNFFYCDTIWLACTTEIQFCVTTNSEDIAINIFTFSFSTLLRQNFLCRDILSVVTDHIYIYIYANL